MKFCIANDKKLLIFRVGFRFNCLVALIPASYPPYPMLSYSGMVVFSSGLCCSWAIGRI